MTDKKFPVMVLAGSDQNGEDALLEYAGVEYKALIKLNGKTVLEYILDALHESGSISHYYIVGLPKEGTNIPTDINSEDVTFMETIGQGVPERVIATANRSIDDVKTKPNIFPSGTTHGLFIACDIPFVKPEMINEFIVSCGDLSLDLYPSIVREEAMLERFPQSIRTFGKLREGKFCLGDIACFDYSMVEERLESIRILRKNRKKFLMVILKMRPSVFIKYLFGRMTLKDLRYAANKVFNVKSNFIVVDHAEIAMDIDKPQQLDLVREEYQKMK